MYERIEKPEGVIFLLPSEEVSRVSALMQMGFPYHTDHRTPFFSWPPSRWLFEENNVMMISRFSKDYSKFLVPNAYEMSDAIH